MRWKAWMGVAVLLAATCLAADRACERWLLARMPSYDTNRLLHIYHEADDEIPIFGTSKVGTKYDPAELGLKCYNYGMNGISYEVTDVLLGLELERKKTTPIIIEPEYEDPEGLGDTAKYIPLLWDPHMRQLLERFHQMSWRYYVPGLRYFGWYDSYLRAYTYQRAENLWSIRDGYVYKEKEPPFDRAALDMFVARRLQSRTGYFPNEDQERRLLSHITTHPERLFFLVYSPHHPSFFAHFQNEDKLKLFHEKLRAIPNVVLIDWSRMEYPDEQFLDTVHLRQGAAKDFSRKLGEKIREVLREREAAGSHP